MELDGAYQWQANSEETSSWQSQIRTGSHSEADWHLIPSSLFWSSESLGPCVKCQRELEHHFSTFGFHFQQLKIQSSSSTYCLLESTESRIVDVWWLKIIKAETLGCSTSINMSANILFIGNSTRIVSVLIDIWGGGTSWKHTNIPYHTNINNQYCSYYKYTNRLSIQEEGTAVAQTASKRETTVLQQNWIF